MNSEDKPYKPSIKCKNTILMFLGARKLLELTKTSDKKVFFNNYIKAKEKSVYKQPDDCISSQSIIHYHRQTIYAR